MPSFTDCFARNQGSLTDEQQHLLQKKRVAVIGCGGLGGYVIEELVRIGVGQLDLFDPDVFSPSNCNRQLNALVPTLGQNKAEVAASRAASIHPFSKVTAFPVDFRIACEEESLQVDVAVDCLDNLQARRDLAALCNRQAHTPGARCGQRLVRPGGSAAARQQSDRAPLSAADG